MSHGAHAQEFSLVGDWANKDQSSDWWGFIPTQAQWERIDSLQLNAAYRRQGTGVRYSG